LAKPGNEAHDGVTAIRAKHGLVGHAGQGRLITSNLISDVYANNPTRRPVDPGDASIDSRLYRWTAF
jgi:hypothetical protein